MPELKTLIYLLYREKKIYEISKNLLKNDELYDSLKKKKKLPYEELLKVDKVTKKVLERHRKYLIMATVVFKGDYPHLAEYVRNIRKYLGDGA